MNNNPNSSNSPTVIQIPSSILKTIDRNKEDKGVSLSEFFYLCVGRWYWFLLSICLCLAVTILYLLCTPKIYTRTMDVLIKSEQKDYNAGSMGDFAEMGLFQSSSNVNNEIIAMLSPALALDVVREMELNTVYQRSGFFKNITLYGKNLPIHINFLDALESDFFSCRMELSSDGSYKMLDLKGALVSGKGSDVFQGHISNDTVQSPFGRIIVETTAMSNNTIQNQTILVKHYPVKYSIGTIMNRLNIAVNNKQATVISLTYQDDNPLRAEDILLCLIENYNRNWVNDKNQIATSTSRFINERLQVIEQELGNVDSNISEFQSQNLMPDVNAANQLYLQQANSATESATKLSNQLYMAKTLRDYVISSTNNYELLPANSGVEGFSIENFITRINDKLLQRQNYVANSSQKNPVVIDLEKEINELRASLIKSIDNQISSLQTQINSANRTKARSDAQIATNPNRSKYLLSVERQQKVKESLYLYLLQKREENELSQAFTAYNTRIITPPIGSDSPSAPRTYYLLFISLLVGIFIPGLFILLREYFTTVVRGRKDIEGISVPFIGELPLNVNKKMKKRDMIAARHQLQVLPDSRNLINEAFRVVRTNIELTAGPRTENPAKTILVTSYNPGSGKTFVAMNLAATYALAGHKVLVIDLDIRKSSASRFVNRPKEGLTSVLGGYIEDWHQVLRTIDDRNNLVVLPSGHSVPNPTELLRGNRLSLIIEQARKEFDIVFFDCPPYEVVADASLVGQYADLTLFIVRCGLFQRSMKHNIEQLQQDNKFPRLNIVLNGSEVAKTRYGFNRYGYSYGYGYGNSTYYENDTKVN